MKDTDFLDKLLKKIEKTPSSVIIEMVENELRKEEEGIAFVSRKDYFDWLTKTFLQKFSDEVYHTEDFLYSNPKKFTNEDRLNESKIGWIENFFDILLGKQNEEEELFSFYEKSYLFKYNNQIYTYILMVGQGAEVMVRKAFKEEKDEALFLLIDLDQYFKNKE